MIRYPGSKDKITKIIMRKFPSDMVDPLFRARRMEYREPFFGAGAVGLAVLPRLPPEAHVWLNDKDLGIVSMWKAILDAPESLMEMIDRFEPSVDRFDKFKEEDGRTDIDPVRCGFQKLALHQISYSGLGFMAGGPLGGRKQSSEYNVDCRWNPSRLKKEVRSIHNRFRRFKNIKITCRDFSEVITGAPSHAFVYADPPYYEKGPELYKHSMSDADHLRLASLFKSCGARWVLSYDDHPFVRNAYSWARIEEVNLTYSIAVSKNKRRKNSEVIILPPAATEVRAA